MTDPTPEPVTPEPTDLERVAQLAAEAATRALPADPTPRLDALERSVQQILQALNVAASPEGNAAKLAGRLDAVEKTLTTITTSPPVPHPGQQKLIDDLRLKVATLERKQR